MPTELEQYDTLRGHLANFFAYLRAECGLAVNTVKSYRHDLGKLARWMARGHVADFLRPTLPELSDYLEYLHDQGLSPATIARHIASLRMFTRFLILEGYTKRNAAALLETPRRWQRLPKALTYPQVEALLLAPCAGDRYPYRDRGLLETLYANGGRVSEVTGLKLTDMDFDGRRCVLQGKGSKQRLAPVGRPALAALRAYLTNERPALVAQDPDSPWLFVAQGGQPLSRFMVWVLVTRYAERAGLPASVHPHTLRHSCATHLLAGGADLLIVAEILGHANLNTTQWYTEVEPSRLREVHRRCHPRGRPAGG